MPSLNDVVRQHTDLTEVELERLHALLADWQLLADLSFADLILWLPERTGEGFRAGAQMRPTTGPTAYVDDLVGTHLVRGRRPLVDAAYDSGVIRRDGDPEWWDDLPVRVEAIPVRVGERVVAVIARTTNLVAVRTPSRLELVYLEIAGLLARMVTEGRFPPPGPPDMGRRGAPRVGDGLLRLDSDGLVTYASPNAISAYRRLGMAADLVGAHLGETTTRLAPPAGVQDESVSAVVAGSRHRRIEVDGGGIVLALRIIPLDPGGVRIGALVLVRDVSEVRRRERELMTKDATIREIHHRVKNNLQTVAALLRLQARRLDSAEARAALAEAEHRVASIAVVHDLLSQTLHDSVEFDTVARRLLSTVLEMTDDAGSGGATVQARVDGSFGMLPGAVATPLAMALTEVLQNAVEHGFDGDGGSVLVRATRTSGRVVVEVSDDGKGLPVDFDPARNDRLGLQIVRTLVSGELGGTLWLGPAGDPEGNGRRGTLVVLDLPVDEAWAGAALGADPDAEGEDWHETVVT